jgi:hypothetical protein
MAKGKIKANYLICFQFAHAWMVQKIGAWFLL